MTKYRYTILAACLLFFASCEKVIEFDGDVKKPKLVVNSIFNNEDTFQVEVSNSLSLVDNADIKNINNAQVSVFDENNELVSTPQLARKGLYQDPQFKPTVNKNYRIEVSQENYDPISANDLLPPKVEINQIDTSSRNLGQLGNEFIIDVSFYDPDGKDYYMITVSNELIMREIDSSYQRNYIFLTATDPNLSITNDQNSYSGNRIIFEDRTFNGQSYTFRVITSGYFFQENNFARNPQITLHHLSKSTYNYFVSLNRYLQNSGDPFATPVQVFSNVEQGFGIFGAASTSTVSIQ